MKPRILIIDWKPKSAYGRLNEIAEIETMRDIPDDLDGLQGIIVHATGTLGDRTVWRVLRKAEQENVPVLIEGMSEWAFDLLPKHYGINKSNLHYVGNTNKLYESVLKILGE